MPLLDGGLAAVFGAAFGAVLCDGTIHKLQAVTPSGGGFALSTTDHPAKMSLDAIGADEKAASGVPASAVRLTVLRAGLPVALDLDDEITLAGTTYRAVRVDTDPAAVAYTIVAVPV